jgi:TolB-like protein
MLRKLSFLLLLLGLIECPRLSAASSKAALNSKKPKILVTVLNNSSGQKEYEPLREGLADLILLRLSQEQTCVVVDRDSLGNVLDELKLNLAGLTENESLKAGQLIGAQYLLSGGFFIHDGKIQVDSRLIDIQTSVVMGTDQSEGKISDVDGLVDRLVVKLLKNAHFNPNSNGNFTFDNSPVVNLHFVSGLSSYYAGLFENALVDFEYVLHSDPTYSSARYWLGMSYKQMDELSHAKIEFLKFLKDYPNDPMRKEVGVILKGLGKTSTKVPTQ